MDDQVAEVKSKTDIASIIGERIELKKAGRNYKANCPFHGEKTPSFMVSPELQIFKCFGCGEAGDVFSFLEKYEGMEFPEALKYLADRAGVKLVHANFGGSGERERLIEIHSQALKFYNYVLLNHPLGKNALTYLEKDRGLKKAAIEEFQLGFSPENPLLIQKFLVGKKKFTPKELELAGLAGIRGNGIYDRFGGRVIFPLFDHRGNPIGFAGRILPWDKRDTGKYINSPETPIYHKSKVLYGLNLTRAFIKKKKVAIVVEGELDLISSYQAGIKNVVAIKGSALTEEQVRLLSRFAPKFILALDSDFAGDAAARRGITIAENSGVEVKVAKISGYKDPDEAARGNIESYKNDLIKAEGVWDFLIDSVFSRFDSKSGAGKSKISRELVPVLSEIEDKIVQAHYANILAQKLGVPLEAVTEQLSKSSSEKGAEVAQSVEKLEERDRRDLLEDRFLTMAFQSEPKDILRGDNLKLIENPLNKKFLDEYEKFATKEKNFDLGTFAKSLPKELFDGFARLNLVNGGVLPDNPDDFKKELDLVTKELKIVTLKEKLKSLAGQMQEFEKKGDKDGLLTVQNKFNKLAKNLASVGAAVDSGIIFDEN